MCLLLTKHIIHNCNYKYLMCNSNNLFVIILIYFIAFKIKDKYNEFCLNLLAPKRKKEKI